MKTKLLFTSLLNCAFLSFTYSQSPAKGAQQDAVPFNFSYWQSTAEKMRLTPSETKEFIDAHKKLHSTKPEAASPEQLILHGQQSHNMAVAPCTNIDFENGNLNGWVRSCGFHPGFNAQGCCMNPNGQQTIMTGAGLDPAGNFPVVSPGGNFSLRLGNNATGGQADRIEQTFLVSPSNANFTYKYAVVFQDPGHNGNQQPAFKIEMLDSAGAQIPCTNYNVSAGQGIPGFMNSPNFNGVIYKPWSSVLVDLTAYIGQNITVRFTTYDCSLGGHYGYAYIDGSCLSFVSGTSDSVCIGTSKNYCAPGGLATYLWNGPGLANVNGQCVNVNAPGIYTCQTTLFTGCSGPQFTYTLSNFPNPVVSFNTSSSHPCATQYSFTSTSSIASGYIASYNWNFGGPSMSPAQNPAHNFAGPGTYPVSLTATSNKSCTATGSQTLAIYPHPVANFTFVNSCQNSAVNFTNTSSVPNGNIIGSSWTLGNGNTSSNMHASQNYNSNGSYVVSLTVTSNQNCTATNTKVITIHPLPMVGFQVNNVCQGSTSNFTNTSTIAIGNITNYVWDFENDGQPNSFAVNPTHLYGTIGNYTVILHAVSNYNCVNSASAIASVFSNPTASFTAKNVCFGENIPFVNQSSVASGQIINYAWNFGNGSYTSAVSPQYNYNAPGNYSVQLTAQSNNGCINTYSMLTQVFPLPVVDFSGNNACLNQTTHFTNNSSVSGGSITKSRWDFENDGIWNDTVNMNPSIVFGISGTFHTKLEVVTNNNCKAAKTNSVKVHANPVADFYNSPVCLGGLSTFTNTSYSHDGAIISYQWDFNGDNIVDNIATNPSTTYTASGTYMLKLEIQTEHGCVNTKSKSMYVNPRPMPMFTAPTSTGCPQFCVSFTNASTISSGAIVNAFWNFGDGSLTQANMGNPSHCYNTGNYDVSLTLVSDSGCRNTLKKPAFITVYPQPVAGFKIMPEEVDENLPQIYVTSNASGADYTNYYINDQSNFSSPDFNHTLKNIDKIQPLIYQVVKNQYGCADTLKELIKIKPAFAIYIPNTFTPNEDGINDGWFAKGVGILNFNVQVFDRWGHIIFETNNIEEAWKGNARGSSEPIKQDVYIWKAKVKDILQKNHELVGTVTVLRGQE